MKNKKFIYCILGLSSLAVMSQCFNFQWKNDLVSTKNVYVSLGNKEDLIKEIKEGEYEGSFTEIIYASKDKVILSGRIGMIVYDLNTKEICDAVNLEKIDMNHMQGDVVTLFQTNEDTSKILMHNIGELSKTYLYDIDKNTLELIQDTDSIDFDSFKNEYMQICEFSDLDYNKNISKYNDAQCSPLYAVIDENTIAYLIYDNEDRSENVSPLKIVILNTETDSEKVYDIFK